MVRVIAILVSIALAGLTVHEFNLRRSARRQVACTVDSLAKALVVDTASLERSQRNLRGLSSEGGIVTSYRNHAGQLEVLSATFFGETGRLHQTFFFSSPDDYVVRTEEIGYAELLSQTVDPNVANRQVWFLYFCDGELLRNEYVRRADQAQQILQNIRN